MKRLMVKIFLGGTFTLPAFKYEATTHKASGCVSPFRVLMVTF